MVTPISRLGKSSKAEYDFFMPAKKKTTSPTKARKKAAPKKSATPKSPARKTTAKKATSSKSASTSTEQKLADSTLKLVDQAAALLRRGVRTGASTSENARVATQKQAHSILNKATSSLHSLINKIG
jgi:hypothetical protein